MGKRTEIPRTVFLFRPDTGEAWERIVHPDPDMQEALVIAEGDIVARPVILDQLSLQKQGLLLVADDMYLEVVNGIHERPGLQVRPVLARWGEIGGKAPLEIQGLPNVDDRSKAVLHEIYAGLMGHVSEFCFQLFGNHFLEIGWNRITDNASN